MNCLIGLSLIFASITPEQDLCSNNCNSEFGSIIGKSQLTTAYSNCHGNCLKLETNYVLLRNQQIPSGLKWQCVEYARRWLIENKQITFASVKYAYQIWDLRYGTQVEMGTEVPLLKYNNKTSKIAPEVGDLLIYSDDFAITGHVSVIVGVEANSVIIGEQNYFNAPWDVENYSRRLLLDKSSDGTYRIFDDSLMGWVRFGSP
jgi:glutathionylspermidine amidase/synthetase